MAQEIIAVLLIGLVGLISVIVLDILGDDHHSHGKRQRSALPEPRDGIAPHERSSQQSKVAA